MAPSVLADASRAAPPSVAAAQALRTRRGRRRAASPAPGWLWRRPGPPSGAGAGTRLPTSRDFHPRCTPVKMKSEEKTHDGNHDVDIIFTYIYIYI